jgi:AraC-like DNA-binding protein
MEVAAEGNATRAFVYLPMEGAMEIQAAGKKLCAVPGGPAFVSPRTKITFRATAIRCVVLELPARKLRAELAAWDIVEAGLFPFALTPGSPDACAVSDLLHFAIADLERLGGSDLPPLHLSRLEAHLIAVLARAVAGNIPPKKGACQHIGHLTVAEVDAWLRSRLHTKFELTDLAAAAGVTMRALQKGFLRHFHTSPHARIRDLRLDAARERFLDPACRRTITQVAGRLQFPHLGRFATTYHGRFGETPSQTLHHHGK